MQKLRSEHSQGQVRAEGLERTNAQIQIALPDLGSRLGGMNDRLHQLENEWADWQIQGAGAAEEAVEHDEEGEEQHSEPSLVGDGAAATFGSVGLLTPRVDLARSDTPPGTMPQQSVVEDGLSNWWAHGAANAVWGPS